MNWLTKIASQTLYHGTNVDLSQFDLSFAGQRDWGDLGIGVYLGRKPLFAEFYAEDAAKAKGGRPRVYEVRADISNTANMDDPQVLKQVQSCTNAPFPKQIEPGQGQSRPPQESREIAECIQSLGYDSASLYNGQEIVVYDPSKLHIVREYPWEDII